MERLFLLFIVAIVVAIFLGVVIWNWRRSARAYSAGAGKAAVPLHAPPSISAPSKFLPIGDDAQKTQASHDFIPTSLPQADTIPADLVPSASASDEGLVTDCHDAEQPASGDGGRCGKRLAQTPIQDALPEVDDCIPLATDVGAERPNPSPVQVSPDPACAPGGERATETIQAVDTQEDVCGRVVLDAEQSGTVAEEGSGSASTSTDALKEAVLQKPNDGDREVDVAPVIEPAPEMPKNSTTVRPRQPAVHRDRRGSRRVKPAAIAPPDVPVAGPPLATRPAAEAKLRLSLHPIRRTARISVVLTRPDGFPEHVSIQADVERVVNAYDTQRYDDLDLPWTREFLDGELRLASLDGFRWLRSARRVHIFAGDPKEPDLISVGAARPSVPHALVCRSSDAAFIRSAANSTGSPELYTHEHWRGIPDGWVVLSGYMPTHAAAPPLPPDLRPLDPGSGLEILLEGGLAIRPRSYAAGHPPRIVISPAPDGATITIGGVSATLSADGVWEAVGWDSPGQHMIDVVPGPSASYEVVADPWAVAGWDFWNAHAGSFENQPPGPWTQAEICGAQIRGPAGEALFAAETQATLIALGSRSGAVPLQPRGDVSVSVGLMAGAPAFLLATTGQRRTQGRVVWLGLTPASQDSRRHDPDWVAAVRMAASRRLPLYQSDALAEKAWRKAKERARRLRRSRA